MGDHKAININAPGRTQTYVFEAIPERFEQAQQQVRAFLEPVGCSMRTIFELDMVVEEVFINIASYAYNEHIGTVTLDLTLDEAGNMLYLTFRDTGVPYDPLKKESPDLSAPAEQRPIGGLGIFLVQKYSDVLSYEYADNENRLTIGKKLD